MLRMFRSRFFGDFRNWVPFLLVAGFFATAVLAPIFSPPFDPAVPALNQVVGTDETPKPPGKDYGLGTFPGGYDVFHSLIWGTRSALVFGLTVALSTSILGVLIGAAANMIGGMFARIGMRVTDAFLAFPSLAGILLFIQVLKPVTAGSIELPLNEFQQLMVDWHVEPVVLGLILFSWMPYSRLTFASIEQQKNQAYVEAARVVGLSNWQVFYRHILPNIATPIVVLVTRDIGGMVVLEAALVFIGISGITEWGVMIAASRNWIVGPSLGFTYWWTFVPVTLVLILFSVSWQLLGQRINEALNPRSFSYLK